MFEKFHSPQSCSWPTDSDRIMNNMSQCYFEPRSLVQLKFKIKKRNSLRFPITDGINRASKNKCHVPKFSFSGRFSSSTPRQKCHPVWVFKGGEIVSVILHPTISVVGRSRQRTFCIQQKSSSKY